MASRIALQPAERRAEVADVPGGRPGQRRIFWACVAPTLMHSPCEGLADRDFVTYALRAVWHGTEGLGEAFTLEAESCENLLMRWQRFWWPGVIAGRSSPRTARRCSLTSLTTRHRTLLHAQKAVRIAPRFDEVLGIRMNTCEKRAVVSHARCGVRCRLWGLHASVSPYHQVAEPILGGLCRGLCPGAVTTAHPRDSGTCRPGEPLKWCRHSDICDNAPRQAQPAASSS